MESFNEWPPRNSKENKMFLHSNGRIEFNPPAENENTYDEFISDPNKPVPYTETITTNRTVEYMTDDQRFASRRPDVLVYQTDVLENDLTIAGPINIDLYVSTTGSDADWIVKLIDVYPDNHPQFSATLDHIKMGGYQQMVRSEVFRGRFKTAMKNRNHLFQIKSPRLISRFRMFCILSKKTTE